MIRVSSQYKVQITCWHLYHVICKFINFHIYRQWICSSSENISLHFFTEKCMQTLKCMQTCVSSQYKVQITCWHLYHVICKFINFHIYHQWICSLSENISLHFFTEKCMQTLNITHIIFWITVFLGIEACL